MNAPQHTPDPFMEAPGFLQLIALFHETQTRIDTLIDAVASSAPDAAAADIRRQYDTIPDFLIPGNERVVRGGPGFGGTIPVTSAAVFTAILPINTSRLGGSIVNSGDFPVTLSLCSLEDASNYIPGAASTQSHPQIWLKENGGSWDFRLGNVLWCGSIVASGVADTTVVVAEV